MRRINLDHLATTPVLPEVWAAMQPFFSEAYGNPSSLHQEGLRAKDALAKARQQIATFIHAASPAEIFFTSGGTEAANLAIKGVAYASQRRGRHLVVSAVEHPAVLHSVEFIEQQGFTCTRVKVNAEGWVDPADVEAALTDQTILVAVQHVNHDLGTIQPVQEIGRLTAARGVPFFVDATASGGWIEIDVQAIGANLLSLAPHRFYGPKGVGVLYRNRKARLVPIQHGGAQEEGRRAGTENVPAIVGAGVAAELAGRALPERIAHTAQLQRRLWEGLQARVPYLRLSGPAPGLGRIATSLNVSTEFIEGEGQLLLCDLNGIAVASGSSCVSKSLKISHVLAAIGLDQALAQGNLILSLGRENTAEDVDYFLDTFVKIVAKLRAMSPMWDEFQRGAIDSVVAPRGSGQTSAAPAAGMAGTSHAH
ncbi:MAG: cysteine desulfurase [Verrucomicrobia bacterium]|nr:cysteine desulfurase [Verrucomicrobiota bacterium]